MALLRIGTSGWNYPGWRGSFYPENLPSRQWLSFYGGNFNTTEVNYSFYHLPRPATYENWYAQTPENFLFALKASRLITHIKRLANVSAAWKEFVGRALTLREKLGPILLQFPPSFHATAENLKRIERFLSYRASAPPIRIAMEFRHESCFGPQVLGLLRDRQAALVISHSSRYPVPGVVATAPFVYFRFHGPRELFASSYSDAELRAWAAWMKTFLKQGRDVFAYFNNDAGGYAVPNALSLIRIVGAEQSRSRGSKVRVGQGRER